MNIQDLEALVAVVDTGSIVGAAERLHISQPAVTRRIQNLEESLDTPLLCRDARPIQLTTAAKEVYEIADRVLASVHELETRFRSGRPRR
jgi:DNA-binding transcriptional LysR family regulator